MDTGWNMSGNPDAAPRVRLGWVRLAVTMAGVAYLVGLAVALATAVFADLLMEDVASLAWTFAGLFGLPSAWLVYRVLRDWSGRPSWPRVATRLFRRTSWSELPAWWRRILLSVLGVFVIQLSTDLFFSRVLPGNVAWTLAAVIGAMSAWRPRWLAPALLLTAAVAVGVANSPYEIRVVWTGTPSWKVARIAYGLHPFVSLDLEDDPVILRGCIVPPNRPEKMLILTF
jgi:hypothetical protein